MQIKQSVLAVVGMVVAPSNTSLMSRVVPDLLAGMLPFAQCRSSSKFVDNVMLILLSGV